MCIPALHRSVHKCPVTQPLNTHRCRKWLDTAYFATDDSEIRTLIEDLDNELLELGHVDPEMNQLVLGALESVASAIAIAEARS